MSVDRPEPQQLAALLQQQQRRFMAFLTPRAGSREAARDVLQSALVKAMEAGGSLREGESATAWFFRLLRNALIDAHRRAEVERRALDAHAAELAPKDADDLLAEVCSCVSSLSAVVKADYEKVVRAVDLEGRSVNEFAAASGITPGNARVRLHRARAAMATKLLEMCGTCCAEGCRNCPCESV